MMRSLVILLLLATPALAQDAPARTRAEAIAEARADQVAELWPERQSPMVDLVNGLVDRGLKEGLDSGRGANGFQFVLGGTRSGQGASFGIGHRRSDLLRDHLDYRTTVRGTIQGGYLVDLDLGFRGVKDDRARIRWYSRFENSPDIDYYGLGNETAKAVRGTFRYQDFSTDVSADFEPVRHLHFGATGGYLNPYTAEGGEALPPIDSPELGGAPPGFNENTQYTRIGAFVAVDSRDSTTGPRRGGFYAARYREYWDVDRRAFAFRQTEFEIQQYLPYFNLSRVVAMRAAVVLSYPKEDNVVPFYLQPTIGGNDDLRGFGTYRFRDYHALALSVEHRWHAFSLLDMAVFADAGKVVPLKRDVNVSSLNYSGGIGFRFRLGPAVLSRIDLAGSSEGFRFIWTFSDIYGVRR